MLCLRDALAFFETVFVARDAVFAARPRTSLPPRDLDALDLDAAVFAGVLLRAAPVLDTVFLEAVGFCFLEAAVLFAGGRPRALIPRPDLEAVLFGDLARHDSFELESSAPVSSNSKRGATARVPIGGEPHFNRGSLRITDCGFSCARAKLPEGALVRRGALTGR